MMKYIYTLVITFAVWNTVVAQEGVRFRDLAFNEALAQAKAEDKLVFMDCYTSWCGPCKVMAEEVFPQKAAGDFFNTRFVCVKYDMEKGEARELAKRFNIHAYPTFLIIRPNGEVQHRIVGRNDLEPFIEQVERGLNPTTCLCYLEKRHAAGQLDKRQMMSYRQALADADLPKRSAQVYRELWGQMTDEEKMSEAYWSLYEDRNCAAMSPQFAFLRSHQTEMERCMGRGKVQNRLFKVYSDALNAHVIDKNADQTVPLPELKLQIAASRLDQGMELEKWFVLAEHVKRQDIHGLVDYILDRMDSLSFRELQTYVYTFYRAKGEMRDSVPTPEVAALNCRVTEKAVQYLEIHRDSLSIGNIYGLLNIFDTYIKYNIDKAQYARVISVGKQILAEIPAENPMLFYIQEMFNEFCKINQ